ncbi:MAG: serine hydroxymethyltransferase [Deltaproteobacteria bacterium]|nr:serine hydroxymethyltransferase [Deltaproteobacteria bacterium]
MHHLKKDDPRLAALVEQEATRIETTLDLIAAESHSPRSIMEVLGSILNTKTIEGYPGRRFHAGCVNVDEIENIAIRRAKRLFGAQYANVQPHSGTSANLAVYFSVLNVGDRILSMGLPYGGHLSHGHKASITSKCFEFTHYGVDPQTERIDYDQVRKLALQVKPRMIVAGASSYPRLIDYEKIAAIAEEVHAYSFADMAHLAGLVAGKVIPSPVPCCDFVTFTTYKTMMGGRGGVILAKDEFGQRLNSAVFPGCQGTSAVNLIAAKALIFKLAGEPRFIEIQRKTLENAVVLARLLDEQGYRIISGGTDNHQILVDLTAKGLKGAAAEKVLEYVGIVLNRNVIPRDATTPGSVSGLRLGSAGITARGMGQPEMVQIADMINAVLSQPENPAELDRVKDQVKALCRQFPVYA